MVCRDHFHGRSRTLACPNLIVKGGVRVYTVTGHRSTLTLEESKTIKAKEKAARQARELARATAFATRLAPAVRNPALAANPGAAAAAAEIAARYSASASLSSSSSSSALAESDLALAHSYAAIDEAIFSQQIGDAQFESVRCTPWQDNSE